MALVPQKDTVDPELPSDEAFGARVREARKARGWSQWDLARVITPQVSQATISAIERGDTASSAVLAVCRALDIAPPTVGESADMARWIDVGRVLERFPDVLEYHLRHLEGVAVALTSPRPPASDPPPDVSGSSKRTPRH